VTRGEDRARRLPDGYPQGQTLQLGGVDDLGRGLPRRDRLRARVAGADEVTVRVAGERVAGDVVQRPGTDRARL
jgi:hypothetical protein